jgi:hypothetical protein
MDCITEAIDEDSIRGFLVAGFMGEDPTAAATGDDDLMSAVMDCAMQVQG